MNTASLEQKQAIDELLDEHAKTTLELMEFTDKIGNDSGTGKYVRDLAEQVAALSARIDEIAARADPQDAMDKVLAAFMHKRQRELEKE